MAYDEQRQRVVLFSSSGFSVGRARYSDPIARLSLAEEAAWRARYRPWAHEMSLEVVAATARVSRLQLVLDVVVDNNGVREIEGWYRMRHGLAFVYLRGALHRYCEIAGWIEPDPAP